LVVSLTGISGKSQILFALVFTTRYLDLLTSFISLYNTTMKVRHPHHRPPHLHEGGTLILLQLFVQATHPTRAL
jgi:hypothetical protein